MKAIIAIPVYKPQLDSYEQLSLQRCLQVLRQHPICLFHPEGLDLSAYEKEFEKEEKEFRHESFAPHFFKSQRAYNHLMLTPDFYQRFQAWEYLLIYQLDAYVFSDQLEEWCARGYDYVGAPFLKLNRAIDWRNAGNGGFSLRRVSSFIRLFSHKGNILTARGLWRFYRYRGPLHRLPLTIQGLFGIGNKLTDFLAWEKQNEDLFYSMLDDSVLKWNIPDSRTAMYFSFEGQPSQLYRASGRLPFGCHAFLQNEFDTFYKPLICRNQVL